MDPTSFTENPTLQVMDKSLDDKVYTWAEGKGDPYREDVFLSRGLTNLLVENFFCCVHVPLSALFGVESITKKQKISDKHVWEIWRTVYENVLSSMPNGNGVPVSNGNGVPMPEESLLPTLEKRCVKLFVRLYEGTVETLKESAKRLYSNRYGARTRAVAYGRDDPGVVLLKGIMQAAGGVDKGADAWVAAVYRGLSRRVVRQFHDLPRQVRFRCFPPMLPTHITSSYNVTKLCSQDPEIYVDQGSAWVFGVKDRQAARTAFSECLESSNCSLPVKYCQEHITQLYTDGCVRAFCGEESELNARNMHKVSWSVSNDFQIYIGENTIWVRGTSSDEEARIVVKNYQATMKDALPDKYCREHLEFLYRSSLVECIEIRGAEANKLDWRRSEAIVQQLRAPEIFIGRNCIGVSSRVSRENAEAVARQWYDRYKEDLPGVYSLEHVECLLGERKVYPICNHQLAEAQRRATWLAENRKTPNSQGGLKELCIESPIDPESYIGKMDAYSGQAFGMFSLNVQAVRDEISSTIAKGMNTVNSNEIERLGHLIGSVSQDAILGHLELTFPPLEKFVPSPHVGEMC